MRTGGWIQTISQNNRNKLWNHPKSCSRSENRPLIYLISVLTEYAEYGNRDGINELQYILEYEKDK